MNYNSLFNLLYSTEISEATKDEIVSKLNQPIEESHEVQPLVETYLELLDTLVFSTASEALIYNIIDETFSSLDEEFINEVSDAYIKRKTEAGLKAREKAYKQANDNVIGLASLNRATKAGERLKKGREQVANRSKVTPLYSKPTAMDKLKSAVGKVKSWASRVDGGPEHTGLSRLVGAKANKDNIGAKTLRQQTTHKEEAPKAEVKTPEPKAEAPKVKKVSKPRAKKEQKPKEVKPQEIKAEKVEAKQPEVKTEVKADDATKAVKKTTKKTKTTKATKETIKNGKNKVAQAIASTENKPQEDEKVKNKPKEESKIKIDLKTKSDEDKRNEAKFKREMAARRKDQERTLQNLKDQRTSMTSKPGYDPKTVEDLDSRIARLEKTLGAAKVTEALSDFVVLLLNTNISEGCFVEVLEMAGASKANALKVKDRYEHDMSASLDDINKDLVDGKPIDPEKVKKAEEIIKKKEHFEELFNKKFNDNK